MTDDSTECACLGRRRLLGSAAALGVGAPLLAACGAGTNSSSSGSNQGSGGSGGNGGSSGGGGAADLVAAADVPVGGGVIISDQKIVVTQPTKGEFKGFSAICTHMGCVVSNVSSGVITCPCHGSQYSVKDGSVLGGPAPSPLPAVKVAVKGNEVVKA